MRKFLIIKMQSFSDIITNSSSEVFVIHTSDNLVEAAVEDILRVGASNLESDKDKYSGMGGELMVYTWKNGFRKFKHTREKYRYNDTFTPEKWAEEIGIPLKTLKTIIVVDMDWSREETRNYLIDFYNAQIGEDAYYEPEDGKFIDFIDCYTDYSDDAPYNQDLQDYDFESWLNDYIIAMRDAGYSEAEIKETVQE
jgi:hypothetical protein